MSQTTESHLGLTNKWLPLEPAYLAQWLERIVRASDEDPQPSCSAVQDLWTTIESDTTLKMLASAMFEEIPASSPYDVDPLGRSQIRNLGHLLNILNHVTISAPVFDEEVHKIGWVGFPINVILNWPMSTPSGKAFFADERINAGLKAILGSWADYSSSEASADVLHSDKGGWFAPYALKALDQECSGPLIGTMSFTQTIDCDKMLPHYGFRSWDDFFTRRFRATARPVAAPHASEVIVNPCESRPFRIAENDANKDQFWLKGQPYSLVDMLAHDPLAELFRGGTVYQAFLSGLSYHRWHSPVSGTIVKAFLKPGTYYLKAPDQGFGSSSTSLSPSQAYLSEVATRAIIMIEADNADIGLVCVMPIGMGEVSTCEITVMAGQRVQKGEELGTFHYGGSTCCMIFGPQVKLRWFRVFIANSSSS